jgi:hypothetical protein
MSADRQAELTRTFVDPCHQRGLGTVAAMPGLAWLVERIAAPTTSPAPLC